MEKNHVLRKVVLEEVVTRDGTGIYVGSDFDSEDELVQFIDRFLSAISLRNSTTPILRGHIQTPVVEEASGAL